MESFSLVAAPDSLKKYNSVFFGITHPSTHIHTHTQPHANSHSPVSWKCLWVCGRKKAVSGLENSRTAFSLWMGRAGVHQIFLVLVLSL